MIEREINGPFGTLRLGLQEMVGERRQITSLAEDGETVLDRFGAATADFRSAQEDVEAIFDASARLSGRIDSIEFFSDADANIDVRSFFRSVFVTGDDVDGFYVYRLESLADAASFAEGLTTLIDFFDETDLLETILIADNDPVAQDDARSFEGSSVELSVANLLADNGNGADSDPDGDALSVIGIVGLPFDQDPFGTISLTLEDKVFVTITEAGALTLDTSRLVEFAGPLNLSFDYILADSDGNTDIATVTIDKEIPPSEFELGDDLFEGVFELPLNGNPISPSINLAMNDRYFGNGFTSYELVQSNLPPGASLQGNGILNLGNLAEGDYDFVGTYKVSDFSGEATASFDISITIVAPPPPIIAVEDLAFEVLTPPETFTFDLLANDTLSSDVLFPFVAFSDLAGNTDAFEFGVDGTVELTEDDPGVYVVTGVYEVRQSINGDLFTDSAPFSISVEVLDDFFPF